MTNKYINKQTIQFIFVNPTITTEVTLTEKIQHTIINIDNVNNIELIVRRFSNH